jgi:16S rRNA (cytosine967-C5)-methyltransferase
VFVRVNLLRTSRDELQQQFQANGLDVVAESLPEALRVSSGGRVEEWPGYADGLFSVQDLSAMRAARRLMPPSGSRVLDLCAAPGGKSCHLAELMQNTGEVLAVDVAPHRLERIVENVRRLGLSSVHALLVREDGSDLPRGPFDFILADVPCSNTGVLGRRPEVVWELSPESISELTLIQSHLLRRAAERLNPGGQLLYSTCSIEREENEQLVQQFLAEHPQFSLQEEELLLPGQPADGGYQALLARH